MSMRDIEIEKVMMDLKTLWLRFPDQRLGQILENYVFYQGQRGDKTSVKLFHQEDKETSKILKRVLDTVRKY